MKTARFTIGSAIFIALSLNCPSAAAVTVDQLAKDAESGKLTIGDRGDGAMVMFRTLNRKCGPSKNDGEYRARRLMRYADELVQAAEDRVNVEGAAKKLHAQIYKSSMYESCWKTIQKFGGGPAGVPVITIVDREIGWR